MSMNLNKRENKLYSQNGEDGIIEAIFEAIGKPSPPFFVEFGAGSGKICNCRLLAEQGWSGLFIEADTDKAIKLAERYLSYPNVKTVMSTIDADNICDLFLYHQAPKDLTLLSVDIDGNDYWVLRAILSGSYGPKMVVCEYNGQHPPPELWVMEYNTQYQWKVTDYYGASLCSLTNLLGVHGYGLVACDSRGVNAFFVRLDILKNSLGALLIKRPEEAYFPPHFGSYPHKKGPCVRI